MATKTTTNPPEVTTDPTELHGQIQDLLKSMSGLQDVVKVTLANQEKMQKVIDEQNEQIKFYAGRVKNDEWANKKSSEKGGKMIRLRTYHGKIVTGWGKMTENWAKKTNGVWKENLRTQLFLLGSDEPLDVDYSEFIQECVMIDAEVIETDEERNPPEGKSPNIVFTVRTKDGIELSINSRFVN